MTSISIYFFAGDFSDVVRRYQEGRQQIYQTHNEVARLIQDLLAADYQVNIYSFVTPDRRQDRSIKGLRVINLGAKDYSTVSLLKEAVASDDADNIVAHIANLELLGSVATRKSRAIAILANSYNRSGFRSALAKRKIVSLLNNPRFELVSNHCLPATEHLAAIGVKREKLIAWDIPHPFEPRMSEAKTLVSRQRYMAVYVGSIAESKGIAEVIHALALLRQEGIELHCSLAGLGDIDAMSSLGARLGVPDLLSFLGLIGNDEVFARMGSADLVLVPSRKEYPEGFPLTMFEAIASRTPIVCSDHPMFRPIMVDGRSASIFQAGDYRACAAAIRRTLTDPALYAALSANAPSTWAALKGPADWRTMILRWAHEGACSPWIRDHMLVSSRT